jgi:hypothetical protein
LRDQKPASASLVRRSRLLFLTVRLHSSSPAAADPNMPATAEDVPWPHPDCSSMWTHCPTARSPHPPSRSPYPCARYPYVGRPGSYGDGFLHGWWGRFIHDNFRLGRLWLRLLNHYRRTIPITDLTDHTSGQEQCARAGQQNRFKKVRSFHSGVKTCLTAAFIHSVKRPVWAHLGRLSQRCYDSAPSSKETPQPEKMLH